MSAEKRLQELKLALLQDELQDLAELRQAVADLKIEVNETKPTPEHLAPLMASALDLAQETQKEEMAEALNAVVAEGVKKSVRADKETFADALSPVIGVSIRKAIASALKGFNEAINHAVETSLSPKGLKWRMEAARTGVPFAQLVMRYTLPYALEEIFLIHNETGLLAAHAAGEEGSRVDSDAVSAMLTAIQDFVRDSFSVGDGQLEEVEIGGRTVWVIAGRRMSFAVVVHGTPPAALRDELEQQLLAFHADFGELLEQFSGDRETMAPMQDEMQLLISDSLSEARENASASNGEAGVKKKPWLRWLMLVGLAIAISAYGWLRWQLHEQAHNIRVGLGQRADVVVLELRYHDGKVLAQGLYDPALGELRPNPFVDARWIDRIDWRFSPYRSALPEANLLQKRAAWSVPDSIDLRYESGGWIASGTSGLVWWQQMRKLALLGFEAPQLQGVNIDAVEYDLWMRPQLPQSVNAKLLNGVLRLTGVVALDDEAGLSTLVKIWVSQGQLPIEEVDVSNLARLKTEALAELAKEVESLSLEFASGVVMSPKGWAAMERLAAVLKQFGVVLGIDSELQLQLSGQGSPQLLQRRLNKVRDLLQQRGVEPQILLVSERLSNSGAAAMSSNGFAARILYEPPSALEITLGE